MHKEVIWKPVGLWEVTALPPALMLPAGQSTILGRLGPFLLCYTVENWIPVEDSTCTPQSCFHFTAELRLHCRCPPYPFYLSLPDLSSFTLLWFILGQHHFCFKSISLFFIFLFNCPSRGTCLQRLEWGRLYQNHIN